MTKDWLSVNDSLPEYYRSVWIRVIYDESPYDDSDTNHDIVTIGYYDGHRWTILGDAFSAFEQDFQITHWMKIDVPKFMVK